MRGFSLLMAIGLPFALAGDRVLPFTYNNPEVEWCDVLPLELNVCCTEPESARRQSPINICDEDIEESCELAINALFFNTAYHNDLEGELFNTGNTAEWELYADRIDLPPRMKGGPLPAGDQFQFLQFHFHWGSRNREGSEHTVNNESFPLELHMVHYNTKYDSVAEAVTQPDGLAVLGFLFETGSSSRESQFIEVINEELEGIDDLDGHIDVFYNLGSVFQENADMTDYVTYQGSLTTPLCFESVTWIVFRQPLVVNGAQLDRTFRRLTYTDNEGINRMLNDNFRPVQDLNGRRLRAPRRDFDRLGVMP